MLMSSALAIAIVSFQVNYRRSTRSISRVILIFKIFKWFLWGYSLTFSQTGTRFIGNLGSMFLNTVVCAFLKAL